MSRFFGVSLLLAALGGASLVPGWAQAPAALAAPVPVGAKRPITHDVYDSWRSIAGVDLARNGQWVVYTLQPQDGDAELVTRGLGANGKEWKQARGTGAQLTADGAFAVYTVTPTKAERDKARKEKRTGDQAPKPGMGILTLASGEAVTIDKVKKWAVAEDGSRYVAYLLEPAPKRPAQPATGTTPDAKPDDADDAQATQTARRRRTAAPAASTSGGKKETGSDLVVRDLTTGTTETVADVTDFQWNKAGTRLTYVVAGQDAAKDGVYAREMGVTGAAPVLLAGGTATIKSLTWDDKGEQLAFLRQPTPPAKAADKPTSAADTTPSPTPETTTDAKPDTDKTATPEKPPVPYTLYLWRAGQPQAREIVSGATLNVPKTWMVSENAAPRFSKDGEMLTLGLVPAPKPSRAKDASDPVNVDIWTYNDAYLQPMQKVRDPDEKKRSYLAVYFVKDSRLMPLASADMPGASVERTAKRYALGTSDLPYRMMASWDQSYRDVFLLDLKDGSKRTLRVKHAGAMDVSPSEKYVLYWDESSQAWWAQPTEKGKPALNLTGKLGTKFADEDNDTPGDPSAYGVAGWTKDDKAVLLYDRYDIWSVDPATGAAHMITQGTGRRTQTQFRYQSLDPEQETIPTNAPLLLTALDDRTKATGLYRLAALTDTNAQAERLVMLDKAMGPVRKAKSVDTLLFTLSRFEEFPNLWAAPLASPDHMVKVSDANPQQSQFRWGTAELIDYRNADGKMLRARLIKPEGFDPTKKYPLMVNIYETMTEGLHRYAAPAPGTSINLARYVSNGYVILQPDITYTVGYPGESAMKCVVPAIETVVQQGYIDPARIGIQGHSWGAYQITYLITKTNLFRCVEAGAAVSDMFSAYGGIRWESGMSRAFQYEKTQSRIGATPWQAPFKYLENSPIFWVEKVQTPYLTIHNDGDGAVPWYQGIEFFTAMRRLGKEAYLFDYNGEDHNLKGRENMKHWTVHMAEFFDHYLLGAPRPDWMQAGVGYADRGLRDLNPFYKPAPAPAPGATEPTPKPEPKPGAAQTTPVATP